MLISQILSLISIVLVSSLIGFLYYKNLELAKLTKQCEVNKLENENIRKYCVDMAQDIQTLKRDVIRSSPKNIVEDLQKYF